MHAETDAVLSIGGIAIPGVPCLTRHAMPYYAMPCHHCHVSTSTDRLLLHIHLRTVCLARLVRHCERHDPVRYDDCQDGVPYLLCPALPTNRSRHVATTFSSNGCVI